MTFEVVHRGRGGELRCDGERAHRFAIEMSGDGSFAVYLRGLRGAERERITTALRAWLDETGRERWTIE